jgi:membrane protein DedA with SNARE-associated domain
MDSSWMDAVLAWIGNHPILAGAVIFAIAFCDALIVVGAIVPALPLLFAVGVLIGMGEISGPYAVACASLGAFLGDGLSFWIGRRWGRRLYGFWPFNRYPQLLDRGEILFRRNAFKAILAARYVGAVRPFVPAIAGMAKMPLRRWFIASGLACLSWGLLFLAPGWVLGRAYDAVAAVAGHLVIVLGLLVAVLGLAWAWVLYTYRWFANHADSLLARALDWSHRHPVMGRHSAAVFDPAHRESTSLALLAVLLLAIGWAWFALLAVVVGHGEPLALDLAVHQAMLALRSPLADYPMAALASLGDWPVLAPACTLVLLYFVWRRRWMAAAHWLAALAFGLALTWLLGATVDVVRPPGASSGFGFPSIAVTMSTIAFGFFAVLIAREMPGRDRVWPYLVSGITVAVIGFARLYLGARTEALLMIRDLPGEHTRHVLRMWPTPVQLQPGDVPLWVGTAQTLHFHHELGLVVTWRPQRGADPALEQVIAPLHDLPHEVAPHPGSQLPVLRVLTDGVAAPATLPRPATPAPGPGAGAGRPPAAAPGAARR